MNQLPADVMPMSTTPEFSQDDIPAPLLESHSSAAGVYGVIRILSGRLRYEIPEKDRVLFLDAGHPGIIEPEQLHRVVPVGPVRFRLEFFRHDPEAPGPEEEPAGEPRAYLDVESLDVMVDRFYARVRRDAVLGPIFNTVIEDRWPEHLTLLKNFWSTVLLRTGRYKGNPVSVHKRLINVAPEYFERWLELFGRTVDEIFIPEAGERVKEMARHMSLSLRMGMFGKLGDGPGAREKAENGAH